MKMYHLIWVSDAALILLCVGCILFGLNLLGIRGEYTANIGLGFVISGAVLRIVVPLVTTYVLKRRPAGLNCPQSRPVIPKERWVTGEKSLEIGSRVLALSYGQWYRGHVIKLKTRDRVVVRFVGWDSFWDEIHKRTNLQFDDPDDLSETEVQIED